MEDSIREALGRRSLRNRYELPGKTYEEWRRLRDMDHRDHMLHVHKEWKKDPFRPTWYSEDGRRMHFYNQQLQTKDFVHQLYK